MYADEVLQAELDDLSRKQRVLTDLIKQTWIRGAALGHQKDLAKVESEIADIQKAMEVLRRYWDE